MRITPLFAPLVAFVLSPAVHGINVDWFNAGSCNGASQYAYRNLPCNTCVTPPFSYSAVRISATGRNNRVTIYNQNYCSPPSQVSQTYGNTCFVAPISSSLNSVWVACPGQAADASNTTSAASNISYISYKGDANDTSATSVTGDANEVNEANL